MSIHLIPQAIRTPCSCWGGTARVFIIAFTQKTPQIQTESQHTALSCSLCLLLREEMEERAREQAKHSLMRSFALGWLLLSSALSRPRLDFFPPQEASFLSDLMEF